MKKIFMIIFILLLASAKPLETDTVESLRSDLRVQKEILSILACESGFKHANLWGDDGRSYGWAQFQLVTFTELKVKAGRPELDWVVQADQLWLLEWSIRNGYSKKWTCSAINKNKL